MPSCDLSSHAAVVADQAQQLEDDASHAPLRIRIGPSYNHCFYNNKYKLGINAAQFVFSGLPASIIEASCCVVHTYIYI